MSDDKVSRALQAEAKSQDLEESHKAYVKNKSPKKGPYKITGRFADTLRSYYGDYGSKTRRKPTKKRRSLKR